MVMNKPFRMGSVLFVIVCLLVRWTVSDDKTASNWLAETDDILTGKGKIMNVNKTCYENGIVWKVHVTSGALANHYQVELKLKT